MSDLGLDALVLLRTAAQQARARARERNTARATDQALEVQARYELLVIRHADALVAEVEVIRQECERYGLPLSAEMLLKHVYANRDAVIAVERVRNDALVAEIERLRKIEDAARDIESWVLANHMLSDGDIRHLTRALHPQEPSDE